MKARVFRSVAFILIALAALGAVVMLLWNALAPGILGLAHINFLQALGLFLLARILFGGFNPNRMRRHFRERWTNMTPEEKEMFIKRVQARRGFSPRGFGEQRFARPSFYEQSEPDKEA